jgi:hemerythrin superfamily protein
MHAIKLILEDHDKIRSLFAQLDNTLLEKSDAKIIKVQQALFEELTDEILRHETMEQSFFYPFIKHHDPFKDIISHLLKEEKDAAGLLAGFKGLAYGSKEWVKKYQESKSAVFHHATEEETKLFPKVEKLIPEKLLNDIGTEMNHFKRKAKTAKVYR